MNGQVNLTKRVETPKGLRYCPALMAGNGRVKADYVLIDNKEERHPEGSYYIDWSQNGKRIRKSVGKDASRASALQERQEQILKSKNLGIQVVEEPKNGNGHSPLLVNAVANYLEDIKGAKKS